MDVVVTVVLFLAMLVGLVLVHELGHFITAKRAGVKVHEFGIGFPPRAAVLFRRGETTYTLNWLPIGGFVRLEGEEGESVDPRAFVNQKLSTRLRILIAGVIVNFVLAWLIFTLIALFAQPTIETRLGEIVPDSPAERAGLTGSKILGYEEIALVDRVTREPTGEIYDRPIYDRSGDVIVAIDGQRFPVFDDMARTADDRAWRGGPIEYLAARPAETVVLTIRDMDGNVEDVSVTLRTQAEIAAELGALGFMAGPADFGSQSNGLVESMVIGLERTIQTSTLILRGLGEFVASLLEGPGSNPDIGGPIAIAGAVGQIRTEAPPIFLIYFVALLSANLAVINILPFPPMDGGRITMALLQAVTRNGISPATERMVYLTGFVLLMFLLVYVSIGDISRLVA